MEEGRAYALKQVDVLFMVEVSDKRSLHSYGCVGQGTAERVEGMCAHTQAVHRTAASAASAVAHLAAPLDTAPDAAV